MAALWTSPRRLAQRAELYHQFSRLTTAGIGIVQAVEIQRRSPPSYSFRHPLSLTHARLLEGATFSEALSSTGAWLPAFDGALLHAGEQSGRLPACFELLARHYEQTAALLRKTVSNLLYPALLLHAAILLAPLPALVRTGDFGAYAIRTAGILLPLYGVIILLSYSLQGGHGERWRSILERLLRLVPFFGKARHNLALARLASALEALLNAGVSVIDSWELAAAASGSPALRRVIAEWRPQIEAGVTPAELVSRSAEFPETFAHLYNTGEMTGSLDESLRRLHQYHQDEGSRQLQAVAEWTPKLVYFGIILLIAWQVISFWMGYFNQIGNILGE